MKKRSQIAITAGGCCVYESRTQYDSAMKTIWWWGKYVFKKITNGVIKMARVARVKGKSGIYHIIWRGANRQEIFHDQSDWMKFLSILKKYKASCQLTVLAWCLMNNHVHLLIKEGNEDISVTMKRIGVSYVGYYNWKYRTTGSLFQDRFRSEPIETRGSLVTVVRYIHQNPVKAGIASRPEEWKWSSCLGYYGGNPYPHRLLDVHLVLGLFSDDMTTARQKFKEFNEAANHDKCFDEPRNINRLSDEEARKLIKERLSGIEIPHVKTLPKEERREVLRRVKAINGLSLRQIARIFGVAISLVHRA